MAILELLQAAVSTLFGNAVLVFVLILTMLYQYRKNRRLPPGPYGLPFIGYGPFLSAARATDVAKLCEKYKTDILSVNIYGRLYIFLNTHEITKEAFQKRTDLTDRLDDASFARLDPGYGGIIGSSGQFWREHRRFAISMLRDFGMGRIAAEKRIQEESQHLMGVFRSYHGKPFNPKADINKAVSNVICSITFGKRFAYDDETFTYALDSMNRIMGPASSLDHVTQFMKMLIQHIPDCVNAILFHKLLKLIQGAYEVRILQLMMSGFSGRSHSRQLMWAFLRIFPPQLMVLLFNNMIEAVRECFKGFHSFSQMNVEEHKKTYNGQVNDLIDGYFKEIEKREHDDEPYFSHRQAACLITDLFLAGSETTFTSLRWALLYMAAYPGIQDRVHEELKEVIGPDRAPEMSDKKSTPYTEAVLNEIQRYNTLVQFGVLHANLHEDVELSGYVIPRATPVGANFHQIHRDPATWKNPDQFDPDNFLEDGKFVNADKLIQFSIGRRACAGEALARMELYIFFASWLKDFKISLATDDTVPDLKGFYGGVFMPTPFEVRLSERFPQKMANGQ